MVEFQGSNYQPGLGVREIAKRIRQDIKAAKKDGTLPSNLKTSVRLDRYSGGCSVDVRITYCSFSKYSEEVLEDAYQAGGVDYINPVVFVNFQLYSDEAIRVLKVLRSIVNSYRRDNSDPQVDYFDWNFHGTVEFDALQTMSLDEAYQSYANARKLCKSKVVREAAEDIGAEVVELDTSRLTPNEMRGTPLNTNPFGGDIEDDGEYTYYASGM